MYQLYVLRYFHYAGAIALPFNVLEVVMSPPSGVTKGLHTVLLQSGTGGPAMADNMQEIDGYVIFNTVPACITMRDMRFCIEQQSPKWHLYVY